MKRKFYISQGVLYFYPQRYKGRSPKWSKMYVDLMPIVDVISATNVKIQKSLNSPSQVVHVDKMNVCRGKTSRSWLLVDVDHAVTASGDETADESTLDDSAGNNQARIFICRRSAARSTTSTKEDRGRTIIRKDQGKDHYLQRTSSRIIDINGEDRERTFIPRGSRRRLPSAEDQQQDHLHRRKRIKEKTFICGGPAVGSSTSTEEDPGELLHRPAEKGRLATSAPGSV